MPGVLPLRCLTMARSSSPDWNCCHIACDSPLVSSRRNCGWLRASAPKAGIKALPAKSSGTPMRSTASVAPANCSTASSMSARMRCA